MSYQGNPLSTSFSSRIKQDFVSPSGTSFTMNQAVSDPNDISLYINHVRQEPGIAYTVDGSSTLTTTGTLVSADDMYIIYDELTIQTAEHPEGQALRCSTLDATGVASLDDSLVFKNSGTSFGQITLTDTNNLSIGCTSTDHTGLSFGTGEILSRKNESNADNLVSLGAGSFRFKDLYLGGGVVFDAVTGSATSNTLEDYEEGTFTLTMRGSSGSVGSAAGHTTTCKYVKIGTLVYFNGDFNLTNVGSYSGNFLFSGLPFTVDGGNHPLTLGGHQLDSDNSTYNYLYFATASNTTIDAANPNVGGTIAWSAVGTGAYQVNGTYIAA